jgi:hypothetical protein
MKLNNTPTPETVASSNLQIDELDVGIEDESTQDSPENTQQNQPDFPEDFRAGGTY